MKKFIIKTLGCKTNQAESALMAEILANNNFFETDNLQEADYYILNSCSVTHIAESKSLSYIRKAKRENPEIITVITGCLAQIEKEKILKDNAADFVIGNYEKNDIAEILNNGIKYNVSDIFLHSKFRYEKLHRTNKTRAAVKIQDGCGYRCSYCTIPFARGKNRSNSIKNVIEQIDFLADAGCYEAVLTGIHIGQWGNDFTPPQNLQNLLEKIEDSEIKRYRLGSLNPLELNRNFIDFLAQSAKFCPHFHISLQAVCDKTLTAMNRNYTVQQIKELDLYIKSKFSNAFTGCDIITGFPGESNEDFEITTRNLSKLHLSKIHVFPFSQRKRTAAYKMPNQIDNEEKKHRVHIITKLSDKKTKEFFNNNLNCENEVIIEKNRDKKTKLLKGVTKNYINVLIDDKDLYKNTFQKIKITGFDEKEMKMIAKII